ncbi:MAG TPA: hypothetical protein VFS43_19685 [Polyangiaceae bacterium]|nr:hypothetical protein [Polyangiaceae bacterium]
MSARVLVVDDEARNLELLDALWWPLGPRWCGRTGGARRSRSSKSAGPTWCCST